MEVIGIDRQSEDLPAFLLTFLLNQALTAISNVIYEHGFSSLGTSEQKIDDQMHMVLISCVQVSVSWFCNTTIQTLLHELKLTTPNTTVTLMNLTQRRKEELLAPAKPAG
jgi:hypothetical protein